MSKKYSYEIILNGGEPACKPYVYKYRSTSNIELHISDEKARIVFEQGVWHEPEEFLTSKDDLRTDAIKKVLLLHLLRYSKPFNIDTADVRVDGISHVVFRRDKTGLPLIYSMVERKPDRPLSNRWQDADVVQTILSMPKSAYDGRMNALLALLIAKSKNFYCEKALYLWMSMNGFYNYLAEQVKAGAKGEGTKQLLFCKVMHLASARKRIKDDDKEIVRRKALSLLQHLEMSPKELYDKLTAGQETAFAVGLEKLLGEYDADADPLTFLVIWLPYQIRCNYFHANRAVPMFLYADEALLKSLEYTNYFVERFVEEHLPDWLTAKELSPEQKEKLSEKYKEISSK